MCDGWGAADHENNSNENICIFGGVMEHLTALLTHVQDRAFSPVDVRIDLRWIQADPSERHQILQASTEGWPAVGPETIWGAPQSYFWFAGAFDIPDHLAGQRVYLAVDAQFGRVMGRSDPQCLVRINGELRQGVDFNHTRILLCEDAKAGARFEVLIEAGTIENRRQIGFGCHLEVHDSEVEALYFDLRVPLDVATHLPENDHRRDRILKVAERALNSVDLRHGDADRLALSVQKARDIAAEIYRPHDPETTETVTLLGHTHIDVAWLWRVRETRQKMARSMATALHLMDEYPEYIFMYNQGYLLDTLSQDYPELFARIQAYHQSGRFEIEGALWLEPDANMTGGESLVRQILRGVRYHQSTFGVTPKTVWLPDTFGYSAALPQIMALSGLESFVTHKMSWNDTNKMPSETFWWEGIDGTRVPTYFLTTQPMESTSIGTTYCPDIKASHVMGAWRRLSRKDLTDEAFVVYGHGDGGGGPTREMLENIRRMERGIPGCPRVQHGFMGDFLDRLTSRMHDAPDAFPTWVGELYLEFHRGTFTSVAEVKRNNRKAEAALRSLEALAVYAMIYADTPYPVAELEALWDTALLNQFHDILPGSSIDLVYEDSRAEFETFFDAAAKLEARLYEALGVGAFNATASSIGGVAAALSDDPIAQIAHHPDGTTSHIATYGAQKQMALSQVQQVKPASGLGVSETHLENVHLRAEFDEMGRLSALIDKRSGRDTLSGPANQLLAFRDLPAQYDAWDIDRNYRDQCWPIDTLVSLAVVERGPHRAALRIEWRYESSTIVQIASLAADGKHIEFDTAIDWQEKNTLLKASFPLDLRVTQTVAEMQFGHLARATHANTSWDEARFEYPMHRWVRAGEADLGVAILNDCKYGYDFHDGALRLTILRAPTWPWDGADIGAHRLRYGVYLYNDPDEVPQVAERFNQPLQVRDASADQARSLVDIDTPAIAIESIKKAEDGTAVIVRLYERFGRRCTGTLALAPEVTSAHFTDLLESEGDALDIASDAISLTFSGFEIKTLKLEWSTS